MNLPNWQNAALRSSHIEGVSSCDLRLNETSPNKFPLFAARIKSNSFPIEICNFGGSVSEYSRRRLSGLELLFQLLPQSKHIRGCGIRPKSSQHGFRSLDQARRTSRPSISLGIGHFLGEAQIVAAEAFGSLHGTAVPSILMSTRG